MLLDAIQKRCSRRTYKRDALKEEDQAYIRQQIKTYNRIGGFQMQLVVNNPNAFQGFKKSYGMFTNVRNYIMLIAHKSDDYAKEKLGYYGEKIILELIAAGLGTCWVGGTFDKASCPCEINENEELCCVIAIGYVEDTLSIKENIIAKAIHRKSKTIEQMSDYKEGYPSWFKQGMKAVQLAPSAIYKQPVHFTLQGVQVTASVKDEDIDLGIAMLHFELGAGNGTWKWGNPAIYQWNVG